MDFKFAQFSKIFARQRDGHTSASSTYYSSFFSFVKYFFKKSVFILSIEEILTYVDKYDIMIT